MKSTLNLNARRARRPGPTVAGVLASITLGALLGTSAYAAEEMYHPPTLGSGGGVQAQATISTPTVTPTSATLCWYGMQGWYTVQQSTNGFVTWTNVGSTAASAHEWCFTVTNNASPIATFRLSQANGFAGSGGCGGCHGDKFSEYMGTGHATAYSSIANLPPAVRVDCLVCHTVGYGQPTGFTDLTNTAHLSNVGCESCHGPAGWHKFSDHELIRPAVSIDPKICGSCHQGSHHPTYEEYSKSAHSEVNGDIKYGIATPGAYFAETINVQGTNWYGYLVTTNSNGTLKTNKTTGILHSNNGPMPGVNYLYDPGQDRAVGCGICHSAAARMAMLKDYEARQEGTTNALLMPDARDAAEWSSTCANCHDPHSAEHTAQLRNPPRSANYFTMPTTADKRTNVVTDFQGGKTTNVVFYSAAFANMYNPDVQVCAQCHNSRGGRWDGRGYGYYNTNTLQTVLYPGPGITWGITTNISHSRPPHHSPQYNMMIGIVQDDYLNTTNNMSSQHAGLSSTSGNTNQCIACHVPNYAVSSDTNVTGHSFALDVKGCALAGCHTAYSYDGLHVKIEERQRNASNGIARIVSLLNQWATTKATDVLRTNYGALAWEYTAAGILGNPSANTAIVGPPSAVDSKKPASITNDNLQALIPADILKARFNLYMVQHDGSMGVHNYTYSDWLIRAAETNVVSFFPLANFRATTTAGYTNFAVTFTNLGPGGTTYIWKFGDGVGTSSSANPSYTYTTPGFYTVTCTANGTETMTRTNYIQAVIKPVVSFTADQTSVMVSNQVTFTNTSSNISDVGLWRWSFANTTTKITNSFDGAFTPTFPYIATNAGIYSVTLRASTPVGSSGRITTTIPNMLTVTNAP